MNWKNSCTTDFSVVSLFRYQYFSMKKLTRKEEELMKILWKLKKAFVKDLIAEYPDPKPHYNTISSLVRLLQDKGLIGFRPYGNTYEYFPLLSKEDYRKTFISQVVKDYFDNSYQNAVAFFVKEKGLTAEQLEELVRLIKKED
ncbi:MAG: BlaI/MecI/CopY family transcriptional regulator [Mangrovibacterium sp.]